MCFGILLKYHKIELLQQQSTTECLCTRYSPKPRSICLAIIGARGPKVAEHLLDGALVHFGVVSGALHINSTTINEYLDIVQPDMNQLGADEPTR